MVLQAYIDESVDSNGLIVLAGYIASAEQWAAFTRDWEALLPHCPKGNSGRHRFKMSEMAQREHLMTLVPAFHKVIANHAILSVASVVEGVAFERAKSRISVDYVDNIDWSEVDSPYFVAYRCLMDGFHNFRVSPDTMTEFRPSAFSRDDILSRISGPVDFYFDDHSDKRLILQQWDEYLAKRPPEYREMYGATPRFESDDDFLPLQAADFRAWWLRKWIKEHGIGGAENWNFPYKKPERKFPHLMFWQDEDRIARRLKEWVAVDLPEGLHVRDSGTYRRHDPPAPLEKFGASASNFLRGIFRRR